MIGGADTENVEYRPSQSAYDQQRVRDTVTPNTYTTAQSSLIGLAATQVLSPGMLIKYRMTSPYSVVESDTGNLSEPQWIGYFDSMYQYYHVLHANWNLTFTISTNGNDVLPSGNYCFWVYWKYAN